MYLLVLRNDVYTVVIDDIFFGTCNLTGNFLTNCLTWGKSSVLVNVFLL